MSATHALRSPRTASRPNRQAAEHRLALLESMLRVRRFEERCVELYSAARIRGFMHLYIGEEAVAVGVNEGFWAFAPLSTGISPAITPVMSSMPGSL
ncbi:thiamine pyrophosphate-dependent enzyme [Streptomyces olivaceoviridis]